MDQEHIILNDVSQTSKSDYRSQGSRHDSKRSGEEENDL